MNSCSALSDCRVWKLVFGHDLAIWSDSFCWYNLRVSHKHGILSSTTVNFPRKHPSGVHAFLEMCGICPRSETVAQNISLRHDLQIFDYVWSLGIALLNHQLVVDWDIHAVDNFGGNLEKIIGNTLLILETSRKPPGDMQVFFCTQPVSYHLSQV